MPGIDAREFFALPALADPYPLYARMRARGPLCALEGTRAFFVGHHAAVEEAVRRHAEFSANLDAVLVCGEDDVPRLVGFGGRDTASDVIATADEPAHAVHRRLLLPALKAPRIAALEPAIRAFARERINALVRAGGGDWCAALAEPLPAFVVIRLLGLEQGALEAVRRWAMMGGDLLGGRLDAARLQRLLVETGAMRTWLGEHFDRVRARPMAARGETLTATLAGGLDEGAITREEAVGILVVLFGAAGESTASLLGTALALMLHTPGLQQQLRAQPSLLDAFVEEAVRLESPFKFHYRAVRQATELCGTALLPGDRLLLGWASANRDAAVFGDADLLRLDRAHPQRHLGFGYGIHFCIGAPLARLEVRIALEELLARTRGIAPVDPEQRAFVPSVFVRRLERLDLRLEA